MSRRYDEFRNVLRELFQLDQADLDFGIYRIMAVRRAEIERFLDQDLLPQVRQSLSKYQPASKAELVQQLETATQTARNLGYDPEQSPAVKTLREQVAKATDLDALEDEIFSHLVTFFRRYYKEGDFISQRRYKEDAYAIPYNGEEVKLYWANYDQYYVKSADALTSYAFRTGDGTGPRVRFELAAAEVERDNNKPQPDRERRFILHDAAPVAVERDSTHPAEEALVIRFEYRPDGENRKQDKINEVTEAEALKAAPPAWQARLAAKAPTEADPQRTLLAKHLGGFTKRNTFDFFIHKDLGKFLRRELDFFIKNEIVYLDDLVDVNDAVVKQQLSKAIVLRDLAHKLIDFLAQIENFQKKLWLKKKFVVETHYCITLDRVPRELYPEIAANDRQRADWVRLFAVDEITGDDTTPGYSEPLTEAFLAANQNLVVDTDLFDREFGERLPAALDDIDIQYDGLLLHSENQQALTFLQERYRGRVECIFIDPPYNTSASEIIYKNGFKDSSWLTMISGQVRAADSSFSDDGIMCVTIDDFEFHRLRQFLEDAYSKEALRGVVAIKNNPSGRSTAKGFAIAHEYGIFVAKNEETLIGRLSHSEQQLARYKHKDENGNFEWANFRKHGGANANHWARPKMFYPIFISEDAVRFPEISWNDDTNSWDLLEEPNDTEKVIYPVTPNGDEKTWKWGIDTAKANPSEFAVRRDQSGELGVYRKSRLNDEGTLPLTVWDKSIYSSTEYGTNLLKHIMGESETFSFPKSIYTVMDSLRTCNATSDSLILDYFAGSGTTGHAAINLNRGGMSSCV